jgi:hypothetical protein
VRTLVTLVLLGLSASAQAQSAPPSAAQRYEAQKKSTALAVTLEALSPIAGVGALYADDSDRGTLLAIVSAVAAGAGVGSAFWLIHLDREPPATGVDRAFRDVEQGAAFSVLATAAVVYVVARISGLVLAPEATAGFNEDLRRRLGVPPAEPVVPFHALAPGPTLTVRF